MCLICHAITKGTSHMAMNLVVMELSNYLWISENWGL